MCEFVSTFEILLLNFHQPIRTDFETITNQSEDSILSADIQIHKIKVDSLFAIRFANTILLQLQRTCFAVLVVQDLNNFTRFKKPCLQIEYKLTVVVLSHQYWG